MRGFHHSTSAGTTGIAGMTVNQVKQKFISRLDLYTFVYNLFTSVPMMSSRPWIKRNEDILLVESQGIKYILNNVTLNAAIIPILNEID